MACSHPSPVDGCPDCGSASTFVRAPEPGSDGRSPEPLALLSRGERVGRYVLIDRIGQGGMGQIYAAYDPELDRKVAIKLLKGTGRGSVPADEQQTRLLREAQ